MISPHAVDDLRSDLVETHQAKYWIGCDSRFRTTLKLIVPNVTAAFPMTYLVDCRGEIVEHGDALEAKIEYLLEEIFDPALKPGLHRGLKSALAHYDGGRFGSAWKSAARKLEDEDAALVADATYLRERIEAYGTWKQLMLQREIDAGAYPTVLPALQALEKAFKGMPTAAWAKDNRRKLQQDPKVKLELTAWARLEKAIAKSKKALYDRKKRARVHKEYRAIIEKYPGTLAAREAQRLLPR